ncbi:MAG: hypothetical protein LBI60_07145 [Bacteroidales bacterium]|jgi:hypothetical protein|nr:hypothetical protein [Bacteroidales bacterium]
MFFNLKIGLQQNKKGSLFHIFFISLVFFSNILSAQWKLTPYLEYKSTIVNKNNIEFNFLADYFFKKDYSIHSGVKYTTSDVGSFFIQGDWMYNLSENKKIDLGIYNKYIYNRYHSYNIQEFTVILAGELQTRLFDLTIGASNRRYWPIRQTEKPTVEMINFIYELKGRIFEKDHKYNLTLIASNTDAFYVERIQMVYLKAAGNYKINNRINVFLEGTFIPAGVFNLTADYYGYSIKNGVEITF